MPLIRVRGDVEQVGVYLVKRQLADVTPYVSEYGPDNIPNGAHRPPQGVVRVRRIPGAGGLDNRFGVEQAVLEVSAWAWDSSTVDGRQVALDLVRTAQATLMLAHVNAVPTPFGSVTSWAERLAPTENRNGIVPDGQTWMQATSAVTVIPPLAAAL